MLRALVVWTWFLVWQPHSNGHAVIVWARSPLPRLVTVTVLAGWVSVVASLSTERPALAIVVGLAVHPVAAVLLAHLLHTWTLPPRSVYLSDFVRRPDTPPGTAAGLLDALTARADTEDRTLALHTEAPELVDHYRTFGFDIERGPNRAGRVLMTRSPQVENVGAAVTATRRRRRRHPPGGVETALSPAVVSKSEPSQRPGRGV